MKRRHEYYYDGEYKIPRGGHRGRGRGRGRFDSSHFQGSRLEGRLDYTDKPYEHHGGEWRGNGPEDFGAPQYRQLPSQPIICQEVPIRSSLASGFIGTKGETVTRIRQQSRCRIHVRKSENSTEQQVVEFRGTITQVEKGLDLMREVISTLDPTYDLDLGQDVVCRVDIHPDQVGVVIGKNGTQVKNIRNRTGAWVRVEEPAPGADAQAVVITGAKDVVAQAYAMVLECLESFNPDRVRHSKGAPGRPAPPRPVIHHPAYSYERDPYPHSEPFEPYEPYHHSPPREDYSYPPRDLPDPLDESRLMPAAAPMGSEYSGRPSSTMPSPGEGDMNGGSRGHYSAQPSQPQPQAALPSVQNPAALAPAAQPAPLATAGAQLLTVQGATAGAPPPQVLMLQPDGTYRAVQIVYQGVGAPAVAAPVGQQPPLIIAAQPSHTLPTNGLPMHPSSSAAVPAGSTQLALDPTQSQNYGALSMTSSHLAASQPLSLATLQPQLLQQPQQQALHTLSSYQLAPQQPHQALTQPATGTVLPQQPSAQLQQAPLHLLQAQHQPQLQQQQLQQQQLQQPQQQQPPEQPEVSSRPTMLSHAQVTNLLSQLYPSLETQQTR